MQLYLLSNFFLLFTGLMGLIVIFIILRSYRSNKMTNIYLILFSAFISFRFIIIGYFQINSGNDHYSPPTVLKSFFLFFIPCFYLYFESLLSEKKTFNKKNLFHFILPTACVLWNLAASYNFTILPSWVVALNLTYAFCLILFYLTRIYILLRRKLWHIKHPNNVANYYVLRNWTYFLFFAFTLLGIRVIVSLSYEWINNIPLSAGKYGLLIAAIVWMLLLIKLLISPDILHGVHHLRKRLQLHDKDVETYPSTWNMNKVEVKNEQDLKLASKVYDKLDQLTKGLDNYVRENRVFQQSKTSLSDLADQIGVPKSHLVYLFKYNSNLTFSEYKTYQRILHAIDLIHNGHLSSNTLESLASYVGFASYNPFFTAFKKHTGLSPNEYVMSKTKLVGKE